MTVTFSVLNGHTVEGIVIPKLCHGDRIVHVAYGDDDVNACDALLTQNKELALAVCTADCAPICFSDGVKIGIAHIGWRGLCLNLIEKMLQEFNSHVEIFVGPHLDTFEIQKDSCYESIVQKFGEKFFEKKNGKIVFHFKDAIASVLPSQTIFDERNTHDDPELPSWRRDKTSKRLITVVRFKK